MTQILMPLTPAHVPAEPVPEDGHIIIFDDTRAFATHKWTTTVQAQTLSRTDYQSASLVDSWETFGLKVRDSISDSANSMQASKLQSLLLLGPPLARFIEVFENLVEPQKVDMSILWGLCYLNIKLALGSKEKLKRVQRDLGAIRKALDSLNQCIGNWEDDNTARTEMTDLFDPLLQLLTELIKAQHNYVTDTAFTKHVRDIEDTIKPHLEDIQEVVSHFRQMTTYSKANKATEAGLQARHLAFREAGDANDYTAFPVDNLPPIGTDKFFGRDANITRISKNLGKHDEARLHTYLIYGRRGVGKTQIALEYARRYKHMYDVVFWVRCETSASLRQSFADVAVALELPGADKTGHYEENLMKVLHWLKRTSKKWLLIYDNTERGELLKSYWPREACGSVLLTSRSYYNFENDPHRQGETIDVFNADESWELLMRILGSEWQSEHLNGKQGQRERAAAQMLLEKLGGLALAISQAAKLIRENKVTGDNSIVTLLRLFEEHRKVLPPRQSAHRDAPTHALDTVWSIAFNALSRNARRLMGAFALLSPDAIPWDLFLPSDQTRLDGSLAFCKQTDDALATDMSEDMRAAITELKGALPGFRQFDRFFAVHRVIQEAMNYEHIKDLQDSFNAVTQLLHEAFPVQLNGRPLHAVWPRCQMYVQHVIRLSELFVEFRKGKEEIVPQLDFVRLLSNCGWYLYEIGDYAECQKMMKVACSACENKDSLLFSHLVNTIGSAHYELNHVNESRKYMEQCRDIRLKHLEPDDLQIATILANIGNVESAEGNLDEAQDLFEKAARIRERYGDDEALMLGVTYLQLGRVAFLRKNTYHAQKMYNKAEACFVKGAGDQVWMAHLQFANGNLELRERNLDIAARNYERCRDLCLQVGPVHPLMTAAYYKLACVEQARRNTDKALMYLEKANNIADIRSPAVTDGTVARILWKKSEILVDDDLRRDEGLLLRRHMDAETSRIASELGLNIDPDERTDKVYNLLVPGYFR